jgi:hypothetical protein
MCVSVCDEVDVHVSKTRQQKAVERTGGWLEGLLGGILKKETQTHTQTHTNEGGKKDKKKKKRKRGEEEEEGEKGEGNRGVSAGVGGGAHTHTHTHTHTHGEGEGEGGDGKNGPVGVCPLILAPIVGGKDDVLRRQSVREVLERASGGGGRRKNQKGKNTNGALPTLTEQQPPQEEEEKGGGGKRETDTAADAPPSSPSSSLPPLTGVVIAGLGLGETPTERAHILTTTLSTEHTHMDTYTQTPFPPLPSSLLRVIVAGPSTPGEVGKY